MPKSYTDGKLAEAISSIKQGRLSLSKASREYDVPKSTLSDHCKGRFTKSITGPERMLSPEEETGLVNFMQFMASQGFPMTRAMIRCYIQELFKRSGRCTLFNLEIGPSDNWFRKLLERHPELSERKPENTDKARTRMSNVTIISEFFKFYGGVLEDNKLADKPAQIFNCDETGWSGKETHRVKVIGPKKGHVFKQKNTTSDHVTAHLCVSADGNFLPPLVIFKGGLPHRAFKDGIPGSWMFSASESGYMDTELFSSWFSKIFVPNCGKARPVILIMDNHDSHISLPVVEAARQENIVLVGLPSHTTHILQPLDVHIIGPLKHKFASLVSSLGVANPSAPVGKSKFPVVLHYAMDALPPSTIKEAFRLSGLYPRDQSVIDKSQLVPSLFDDAGNADEEPTRTCAECGHFVGQNPLVKRGLIPQSMADVLLPPPSKPLQAKRRKMVLEGRLISGDEMLNTLQEKEAAEEKKKDDQAKRLKAKKLRKEERQKEEERMVKKQKKEEDRKRKQEEKEQKAADKEKLRLVKKKSKMVKQRDEVVVVGDDVVVVGDDVVVVGDDVDSGERRGVSVGGRLDDKKYTCGVCGERGRVSDEVNGIKWYGCDDDMCVRGWYHFGCLTEPERVLLRESLEDEGIYWYCRFCLPYLYED